MGQLALRWALGVAAVYATLFGVGGLLLGTPLRGAALLAFGAAALVLLVWTYRESAEAPV